MEKAGGVVGCEENKGYSAAFPKAFCIMETIVITGLCMDKRSCSYEWHCQDGLGGCLGRILFPTEMCPVLS